MEHPVLFYYRSKSKLRRTVRRKENLTWLQRKKFTRKSRIRGEELCSQLSAEGSIGSKITENLFLVVVY